MYKHLSYLNSFYILLRVAATVMHYTTVHTLILGLSNLFIAVIVTVA